MTSSCTGNCLTKCRRPKSLGHLTSREEDAASGIFKKGNPKTHERTHTFTVESSKLFSCSKVQLQSELSNSRCVVPGQHQQPLTTTTPTIFRPTPINWKTTEIHRVSVSWINEGSQKFTHLNMNFAYYYFSFQWQIVHYSRYISAYITPSIV